MPEWINPVEPILVVDLFPEERADLLDLLGHLSVEEWTKPTACTGWSVKDVALHLLGDDVGLLSRTPDFMFPASGDFDDWEALLAFINQANDLWVRATRRMSPPLICKFLDFTGGEVYQFLSSIDLFSIGEPVSWAGPNPAPIWFDVAREYTERWLHQQHIREAVAKPGAKDQRLFAPVLDTFIRALPHTFRDVAATPGTALQLVISGQAGGQWCLVKEDPGWTLYKGQSLTPAVQVTMDQDLAWRVFTKGLNPAEAKTQATFIGDRTLGLKVLETVSIIA